MDVGDGSFDHRVYFRKETPTKGTEELHEV